MGYYLYHHGILGQRWGKRNGPPYPFGESDHSASEKKAGWKKSLDKGSDKFYNSDRITSGKGKIDSLLSNIGKNKIFGKAVPINIFNVGKKFNDIDVNMVKSINAPGMNSGYERTINCTHCVLSYILNSLFGMKTTAKEFNGVDEVSGLVSDGRELQLFKTIFDNIKETDYGYDGEDFIKGINNLSNNSTGILEVRNPKTKSGHVINYEKTSNGIVTLIDSQIGGVAEANTNNLQILSKHWRLQRVLDFSKASLRADADDVLDAMVIKRLGGKT